VYLESALDLGLAPPSEVHSELLLIYLHMALEEEQEGESRCVGVAVALSVAQRDEQSSWYSQSDNS
jgi:hypothetical protein